MPTPETDFNLTLDRAANAVLDATCACRAAGHGSLPHPHRRLLSGTIRDLEHAQQKLFVARNDPWSEHHQARHPQLQLL
jgi:hypothetical protein